uniref:PLD phosphodiesterase domain-containing protein n=1 Tax=Hyaloperonospora arabidopsidis (strain Emoy2) TaxID=559515 RepID=M4BM53_HYAAE
MHHIEAATTSINLSAMYWNLLGEEDRKTFSALEMSTFGADRGTQLLFALQNAASRGVKIRILTGPQQGGGTTSLPREVQLLVDGAPEYVTARCWSGSEWYGSGVLHQKMWIFDSRHIYVGSANMDWKSLAQMFASSELLPAKTATYFSEKFQHDLRVPVWSLYLQEVKRSEDPFRKAGFSALGNITHQLHTQFSTPGGVSTAAQMFVAAAPLEATAGHSRAFDEDALVYTIQSARSFVSLSVMDFAPFSMYTPGSLYWPALNDALLASVYSKPKLRVRLLISQWQHTSPQVLEALAALQKQAELCQYTHARCSGRLEIKIFQVPGWQNTTSSPENKARWPSFTRVNHAKYIVTDTRANIGTSNMEWGYFYTTAGASVNTDHESTRVALEKVFERNWNSSYARPLDEVLAGER